MMRVVPARLGRQARQVTLVHGNFLDTAVPAADAVVATYSLHHIRQRRDKQAFYRRCFAAIRPGGVFITGDCAPAAAPPAFARDLDLWFDHLGRTFGGRAKGRQVYESWADEDVYVPLADERRLLERAGFDVEMARSLQQYRRARQIGGGAGISPASRGRLKPAPPLESSEMK
jgi:hypothetical protein